MDAFESPSRYFPLPTPFQHCIIVAKINWTQQFWIGNQFINTKECKFISLDLIMIMLVLFWLLIVVAEMLQYSIIYYNFMFNVWIFVSSKPQFYSLPRICIPETKVIHSAFAFVFKKPKLHSMVCRSIQYIRLTFNRPVKYVVTLRISYFFVFIVSLVCISIQYMLVHSIRWSISCVQTFPRSIYHDWDRLSSGGMTISSFSNAQRLMKHWVAMEKVS